MRNVKQKIKTGMIGLVAFAALTVAGIAGAVDCPEATVTKVGVLPDKAVAGSTSKYMVRVDCSDDNKWAGEVQFMLSEDIGDSGYATLLTAMSLKQPVYIRVASISYWSLATLLYLTAAP